MEETSMREMTYTNKIDDQIVSHESHMLALYIEKVNKYIPLFEENGYSLKVGLMWDSFSKKTITFQRGRFQNGYQCYVYCTVQKDDNDVRIDSIDGEADYYLLSTTWMISSIFRKFYKLNVTLYANTDDVDTDLNCFLSQLRCTK